ncbi:hypothetical protein HALO59_50658 [Halomonas sp. 59]|nr:hypothetical protein HALO156_130423 [Halomonas sp. 156]CAD5288257.1 hypothetical protein HALO113_80661 [Halomonas sp. 113]CAD5289702.1 hypothetical protein HALO59_50658 [Halomonas sp. 59]CAD5292643.1 hypothetical protein HALOI3_60147 [Halomonas sp. I3]VXB44953.1 hypothetical protein HALO153_130487 [Halomonas titanicae]
MHGVFQALPYIVFHVLTMREHLLQQARHSFTYRDHVTLIEAVTQREVAINVISEAAFAPFTEEFSQLVDDKPIALSEERGPHLGDFQTRNIGMKAIKERGTNHGIGEWRQ